MFCLTGTGDAEGVRGDVVGDHGASCGPRPISDRHGRDEDSVAGRADITPDRGSLLPLPIVVGGDVARSDVRVGADLRVADVREVRDLGALADRRVLDLDERPRLRVRADVGARAQVAEGPNVGTGPDAGVDGDDVRADVRPGLDARLAAEHREGLDDRVGLDRDGGVDPRRRRVDDRDAGEHVGAVRAVAQERRRLGQVGAGVDPERRGRVRMAVADHRAAGSDERADGVGQVELALVVLGIEPLERGPQVARSGRRRCRS